jgi:hypothetical protein
MTDDELRPYFESLNFEAKADAANDAARLKAYCESHMRCVKHHHRPAADIENPCPVCGSCVPFCVEAYPNV